MALIGGICCYIVINYIKVKLKYHDALDAFGIHGVGGIIGAVLTAFSKVKRQILTLRMALFILLTYILYLYKYYV